MLLMMLHGQQLLCGTTADPFVSFGLASMSPGPNAELEVLLHPVPLTPYKTTQNQQEYPATLEST